MPQPISVTEIPADVLKLVKKPVQVPDLEKDGKTVKRDPKSKMPLMTTIEVDVEAGDVLAAALRGKELSVVTKDAAKIKVVLTDAQVKKLRLESGNAE